MTEAKKWECIEPQTFRRGDILTVIDDQLTPIDTEFEAVATLVHVDSGRIVHIAIDYGRYILFAQDENSKTFKASPYWFYEAIQAVKDIPNPQSPVPNPHG